METLDTSVKDCCAAITSTRGTERKKNAEMLKDFLTRNAVPSLLTQNTLKKSGYTWNDVYDDIEAFILKETEKFETAKNFVNVIAPLCTSLLHLCVAGSNKGKAYVKCDKIIDSCLLILKDNRLTEAIGDAYISLLYKHVLTYEYYLNHIPPSSWEELLDICISVCFKRNAKLDDFTKLRLLWIIIKNGSSYCQFVIPLRDSLSKLKKYFLRLMIGKKEQDVVIEILILLLEELSSECRLTMCEFIEGVLTSVLKLYDQNIEQKKKSFLFKLLQLSILIHHPNGRLQDESGSLANCWDMWNKHLQNILEIVCLEVTFMQKFRNQSEHLQHDNLHFYNLAASVYYQVFHLPVEAYEAESNNSMKRQRTTFNKNRSFNDIIDEFRQNSVPWLGITYMYVKKYSASVSPQEYLSLMNIIANFIANNTIKLNWDLLEETTCLIIQNLTSELNNDNCNQKEYSDAIVILWNSCVRNSTSQNGSQKCFHMIMQSLLTTNKLPYQNVSLILKLYFENGMPATNYSLGTLNHILNIFFKKLSNIDVRNKCFTWWWLSTAKKMTVDINIVKEFLLRLIANENISTKNNKDNETSDILYDTLFNSIERCILYSEFEFDIPNQGSLKEQSDDVYANKQIELNIESNKLIYGLLEEKLMKNFEALGSNDVDIELLEITKFASVMLAYIDILLKYNFVDRNIIKESNMYVSLKRTLTFTFNTLTNLLDGDAQVREKVELLQSVKEMFVTQYDSMLTKDVRACVDEHFFKRTYGVLTSETSDNDEELYEIDNVEVDPNELKHQCISVFAAYCRSTADYRDDVLNLVLNYNSYDSTSSWEIKTAFQCINLLNSSALNDPPLEQIFTLMQNMCMELFRSPKISFGILKTLLNILDRIWSDDGMRQNSIIMVRSFLNRCEKLYYPPRVAALVYECIGKIVTLNQNQNEETTFKKALAGRLNDGIHSIRLYCCWLLKHVTGGLAEAELDLHLTSLVDIFIINVSERRDQILKDEHSNRTSTVLYSFSTFAETNPSSIHKIVARLLIIYKDKSLDKRLVKKILNKTVKSVTKKDIEEYLNINILSILNFWFMKGNSFNDLPLYVFGFDSTAAFLEKHVRWVIPAETLWAKDGDVKNSDAFKQMIRIFGKSEQSLIETCFSNIIVICLPYILIKKHKLVDLGSGGLVQFLQSTRYADKMFHSTRQTLGDERWSALFADEVGALLLLAAAHMRDCADASHKFGITAPLLIETFYYPKPVFKILLKYFSDLIDENIIGCLCQSQPKAIFKILINLWENVLNEAVLEFKMLSLHTYITFIENIPLGSHSDAFICNFTCRSLTQAVKDSSNKEEIKLMGEGLRVALNMYLPDKTDILQKSVSQAISVLIMKSNEGYKKECASLLNYLTVDKWDHLKESLDELDFINVASQGVVDTEICSTNTAFKKKLETFHSNLYCASLDILLNLHKFLKINKKYVNSLCDDLNIRGFSEDCTTSIHHRIINSLTNILKSPYSDKLKIEACNCLAIIGIYDLKTLVTVPPDNTVKIKQMEPRKYFAIVVVQSLLHVLFDADLTVTNSAVKCLNQLLGYLEGNYALDCEVFDKQILKPFSSLTCNQFAEFKIDNSKFNSTFSSNCWIPQTAEDHTQWLTRVTGTLLEVLTTTNNYTYTLRAVCKSKFIVCRRILPALIGLLLNLSTEKHVQVISEQINTFFNYIWEQSFEATLGDSEGSGDDARTSSTLDHNHKMIIQYTLDVVNFIRVQTNHYKKRVDRTGDTLNYLKLRYDKVSWAATLAGQELMAIYYGELRATALNAGAPPACAEATAQLPGGANLQRIFRKCFVSIGDMDAIEGCGTAHLTMEDERRKHLVHTGHYCDALLSHDIALSHSSNPAADLQRGLVTSLHKAGLHHLALQYINSMPENEHLDDVKYQCLSFLGDWSDFVDTKELEVKSKLENRNFNPIIKAFRYACLKDCLNVQTTKSSKLMLPLNRAKVAISRLCESFNMENCQSVYKVVDKLRLLKDIEDYFSVRCDTLSISNLLKQWSVANLPVYQDFKYLESLISQRSLILEHAARSYNNFLNDIVSLQLDYVELGLCNKRVQLAQCLLEIVKKSQSSDKVSLTESQISWAQGHKDIALSLLRNIVSNITPEQDVKLTAMALRQYGTWMAESKCDNARDIINKYLQKSLDVLNRSDHVGTRLNVYYDIANFADSEYKQVVSYMNSSIFGNKLKCMNNIRDSASSLKATEGLTRDEMQAINTSYRFSALDEEEITNTRAEKKTYLELAMRYYLLYLKQCEENNLSVFRVISLWLDNAALEFVSDEGDSFEDLLHTIPSRKFLTVLPQLAPRLTNDETAFAENLRKIITKCAIEHPHHTLPILFSLKNSDKDKYILNASSGRAHGGRSDMSREARVAAADTLVARLARERNDLSDIIAQMDKLCDATISFANYTPPKTGVSKQKIPKAEMINRLGHLNAIPVPIDTVPIRNDCNYTHISTLVSFEDYFEHVGGINCPKKIICTSSDGRKRIMLVKGKDDLRQDAVMQQVFNIVNTLLEKDPVTSRNKLLIRTYKVVPMSRRSGVLQWCEGTLPFGAYLCGVAGAHAKYRPHDISHMAARKKLAESQEKRQSNAVKLAVFKSILNEFKPVFHYFFTEHYLDPVTWYERRLAYTKSVATSSMVGYILGLGDRHVQNILIDKNTAEVIHIDFGISFDQGKALQTPETVPFRLTQDMIAGFGFSGTEGIFRKCCEKTMQLLRDNNEILLTILEVLLCDPLYSWTVTAAQQNNITREASGNAGGLAERALLSVSSKLSGTEAGAAGGVAVRGQVARLVHAATDPANLSRLFHGWQPYL